MYAAHTNLTCLMATKNSSNYIKRTSNLSPLSIQGHHETRSEEAQRYLQIVKITIIEIDY